MARHIATIRIVTGDRTVEPGDPIGPDELEPAAWAGLVRKGCIVEAAEEVTVGQSAPAGTSPEGVVNFDPAGETAAAWPYMPVTAPSGSAISATASGPAVDPPAPGPGEGDAEP